MLFVNGSRILEILLKNNRQHHNSLERHADGVC